MDLNYLLFQEQTEIMRADAALNAFDYAIHDSLARNFGRLIKLHGFAHRPYRKPGSSHRARKSFAAINTKGAQ